MAELWGSWARIGSKDGHWGVGVACNNGQLEAAFVTILTTLLLFTEEVSTASSLTSSTKVLINNTIPPYCCICSSPILSRVQPGLS